MGSKLRKEKYLPVASGLPLEEACRVRRVIRRQTIDSDSAQMMSHPNGIVRMTEYKT